MALLRPLINHGFSEGEMAFSGWIPFVVVGIFFLRSLSCFGSDYCLSRVGRSTVRDFRRSVFGHLLKLPASYYDEQTSGRILSLVTYNVEQLALVTTDAVSILVREGFKSVGLVVVMFYNSWQLSLIFLLVAPLIAAIVRYASNRMRFLSTQVQQSVAEVSHVTEESVEAYKVIRLFGGQKAEVEKFQEATKLNYQKEMKLVTTNSLSSIMVQMVASVPLALILTLATGSHLGLSAGGFASMVGSMLMLLPSINRLTRINSVIQKGIASANSIFALMDELPEDVGHDQPLETAAGHIVMRNVHFSYQSSDRAILNGINLEVKPGATIALVGPSGAGKSTIVSLLPRFYEACSGEVLLDGIPVDQFALQDLRRQFSYVSQNIQLFSDTVANNVAYGALRDTSHEAMLHALDMAQAREFVAQLPNQEHTMIGENGVLLSGGQRQRLAIARALLKHAPILILDEATSALDSESEHEIQQALETLMQQCTTIVIAHRLSTIKKADQILVIDNGMVKESGTHESLITQGGMYARLNALRFADNESIQMVEA